MRFCLGFAGFVPQLQVRLRTVQFPDEPPAELSQCQTTLKINVADQTYFSGPRSSNWVIVAASFILEIGPTTLPL